MTNHYFTRDNAPTTKGGDLWNDAQVCRRVFAHPEVKRFTITCRATGLWCTVRATFANGDVAEMKVLYGRLAAEIV